MCGIAGFFGNFERSLLEEINNAISHRGPDDSGIYFNSDAQLGLAHRRLSIIDLSGNGHQPMWDATNSVVIIFNGEIYNYKKLRSELENKGYTFKSTTDTEVLLNMYLDRGTNMLSRLNGIYAFALWDPRNKLLFVARDGLGVKPLYYTELQSGFIFSSELKAIVKYKPLDKSIDRKALNWYMTYLWCPAPQTMLKSIKKLEPGYALIVKNGKIEKKWRHYDIPFGCKQEYDSPVDTIEELRKSLRAAVQRQMVADVPVGAFLSGGIDSSAVALYAREFCGTEKLQCFTIGFSDDAMAEEGFVQDLPYAQQVARLLDVDLHTITVGPEIADELPRMIYYLDEPQADPAPLNALAICELARKHGIKVLLSGAGGDDLFSGYRRHLALHAENLWSWLPEILRRQLSSLGKRIPIQSPLLRRLTKAFAYAHLEDNNRIASYFHWIDPSPLFSLYSKDVQQSIIDIPFSEPLINSLSNLPQNADSLTKMLYLECKHFLADHNLNYTDKMSMAASTEVRVPLLDLELVDFAAKIPSRFKQHGVTGKWILKKAIEPFFPKEIIHRSKAGFGAPVRSWFKDRWRPHIDEYLSEKVIRERGLFDPEAVALLVARHTAGKTDAAYTLLSMISIEIWCRQFIDGKVFI